MNSTVEWNPGDTFAGVVRLAGTADGCLTPSTAPLWGEPFLDHYLGPQEGPTPGSPEHWACATGALFCRLLRSRLTQTIRGNPLLIVQVEKAQGGRWHIHYAYEPAGSSAREGADVLRRVTQDAASIMMTVDPWTVMPRKNKQGGWRRVDKSFINNYLLPKQYPECVWRCSDFNFIESSRETDVIEPEPEEPDGGGTSKKGTKLKQTERWCLTHAIYTDKAWLQHSHSSFYNHKATTTGCHMMNQALAAARMQATGPDFINLRLQMNPGWEDEPATEPKNNKVIQLLTYQNLDPGYCAVIFYKWLCKETGKKNCIWFYGPPTTGKSWIADGLARFVANYGTVNHNNPNFPFQDLVDKALGWWDEGMMTIEKVEQFKMLAGGLPTRVDMKCRQSVEIIPPPLMITSNGDITLVHQGNIMSVEHRPAIQDRTMQFCFNSRLSNDFGVCPEEHMREFLVWGRKLSNRDKWYPESAMHRPIPFQVLPCDRALPCLPWRDPAEPDTKKARTEATTPPAPPPSPEDPGEGPSAQPDQDLLEKICKYYTYYFKQKHPMKQH
ncbi:NS1 [Sesavirus CSL10538]|uniref:NS1 n=1 Tax=Sesavirus CSL10538 TaxID=1519097 RepID=A0A0B4MZZ9_9VIRU|nr:NS1 [Sesavirus CSL10538]AIE58040.1 NS1 [Sesavirus CSL10538]